MRKLIGRREEGWHPELDWVSFRNRWVARDENGVFVDFDQYRHDLEDRLPKGDTIEFIEPTTTQGETS